MKRAIALSIVALCLFWIAVCILHSRTGLPSADTVRQQMQQTADELDKTLCDIEYQTDSLYRLLPAIDQSIFRTENIQQHFDNYMQSHPDVQSILMALNGKAAHELGDVFPYSLRRNNLIEHPVQAADQQTYLRIGNADWYAGTFTAQIARWSRPYQNENGQLIVSRCLPLRDSNDDIYGVLAVNYTLQSLVNSYGTDCPLPHSRLFITDLEQSILGCTQAACTGLNLLSIMEQEGWDFNVTDYDNLNWEQSGNLPYRRHGKECILYHALLPRHPQWILLLDVSSSK